MDITETIEKEDQFENMESGNRVTSHVVPSENDAASDVEKPMKPRLITHMSLMREDSPLLDPSKPSRRKTPHLAVRLWKSYQNSIDEYPLVTKCLTSAILTASGEVISQLIVSLDEVDMKR